MQDTMATNNTTDELYDIYTDDGGWAAIEEVAMLYENISKYLWIVLFPIILLVGVVGNGLNIVVLIRMKFMKNVTLLLIFILAITDIFVLWMGLPYWVWHVFQHDILDNDASCKLFNFLDTISRNFSSWIVVSVTIVRFIKLVFPVRAMGYSHYEVRHALIFLAVVFAVLVLIDLRYLFAMVFNPFVGCEYKAKDAVITLHFWTKILLWLVIPFTIILVCNSIMLNVFYQHQSPGHGNGGTAGQSTTKKAVRSKVTRMVVVENAYFLFATLPYCIVAIILNYSASMTPMALTQLSLALTVTTLISHTKHADNLYIYMLTNTRFRDELKSILRDVSARFVR
jgi:hypothetical protein